MANTITHKRSSTASAVPSSGSLVAGELAINTADGKLFLKKDNLSVVEIGKPAGSSGQVQVNTSGAFAADAGLVYNNTTAGYEAITVGTGTRNLTLSGRVATGSVASAIQSSRGLDIESMSGEPIYIGDAQGQYDGTIISIDSTTATIALEAININITAGSLTTVLSNVNLQDKTLSRVELLDYFERYSDLGDFTAKATQVAINLSTAQVFRMRITVACTGLNVTNVPDNGNANAVGFTFLLVGDGTGRTMNWTIGATAVTWAGGTAPTYTSTNNKTDVYSFLTRDGGTTWFGFVGGQNF
jgi:hypothetical protein